MGPVLSRNKPAENNTITYQYSSERSLDYLQNVLRLKGRFELRKGKSIAEQNSQPGTSLSSDQPSDYVKCEGLEYSISSRPPQHDLVDTENRGSHDTNSVSTGDLSDRNLGVSEDDSSVPKMEPDPPASDPNSGTDTLAPF